MQKIPKKVQELIESIPEKGARRVTSWSYIQEWNQELGCAKNTKWFLGKLNGRLGWLIEDPNDSDTWSCIWIWDYLFTPEDVTKYFGKRMPKLGEKYEGTFI